jgi:hypothetical protein
LAPQPRLKESGRSIAKQKNRKYFWCDVFFVVGCITTLDIFRVRNGNSIKSNFFASVPCGARLARKKITG